MSPPHASRQHHHHHHQQLQPQSQHHHRQQQRQPTHERQPLSQSNPQTSSSSQPPSAPSQSPCVQNSQKHQQPPKQVRQSASDSVNSQAQNHHQKPSQRPTSNDTNSVSPGNNLTKSMSTVSAGQSHAKSPNPSYHPQESTRGRLLTYQELSRCFHLPINSAARELGVCVTALKKQCRKHGVQRWPHRKLKSLDKLKEKLEKEEATAADKEYYKHEIHSIVQKKDHIFRANPVSRDLGTAHNCPTSSPQDILATSTSVGTSTAPCSAPQTDLHINPHTSHPNLYIPGPPEQSPSMHSQQPFIVGSSIPVGSSTRNSSQQSSHNGTSALVTPLALPTTHISLCGILGCDCYINGGVSSQNLHMPLPPLRTTPNGQPQMSGNPSLMPPPPSTPHGNPVTGSIPGPPPPGSYYGVPPPPGYTYAGHIPYVAAAAAAAAATPPQFHNMVQVNVMDHQTYHQAAAAAAQGTVPSSQPMPQSSQSLLPTTPTATPVLGNVPNTRTPHTSPHLVGPSTSPNPNYDVYASSQMTQPVAPSSSVVYGGTSTNGQASSTRGSNQQHLPAHYWTADMGQIPGANNTFTLFNQSTHFHHHHSLGEHGTNTPNQACSSREGAHDATTSSATNNSNAVHKRSKETRSSDNKEDVDAEMTPAGCVNSTVVADSRVAKLTNSGERNDKQESNLNVEANQINKEHVRNTEHTARNGDLLKNEERKNSDVKGADSQRRTEHSQENKNIPNEVSVDSAKHVWVKKRRRFDRREGSNNCRSTNDSDDDSDEEKKGTTPITRASENQANQAPIVQDKTESRTGRQHHIKRPRSVTREENVEKERVKERWHNSHVAVENCRVNGVTTNHDSQSNGHAENIGSNDHQTNHDSVKNRRIHHEEPSSSKRDKDNGRKGFRRQDNQPSHRIVNNMNNKEENRRNLGPGEDPPSPRMSNGLNNHSHTRHNARGWNKMKGHATEGLLASGDGKINRNGIDNEDGNSNGVGGDVPPVVGGGSGNAPDGTSSACIRTRARRYENVVHGCVAVGCAQWCTDKGLRVTLAIGTKALLAMLGVGSVGRNVLDGQTDTMVENAHDLRRRYGSAVKGHRFEWTVTQGRKQFIVVVAPFRKKGGSDICGVSGLILELTQCWDIKK